jgi:hypothetical protein
MRWIPLVIAELFLFCGMALFTPWRITNGTFTVVEIQSDHIGLLVKHGEFPAPWGGALGVSTNSYYLYVDRRGVPLVPALEIAMITVFTNRPPENWREYLPIKSPALPAAQKVEAKKQ